jgi:hypothetical protein
MLIASLQRLVHPNVTAYAASDPFDGEMLTGWHESIMAVQNELEENDSDYGLMTACYQGESDVPARPSEEDTSEFCCASGLAECNSVYCQ